MKIKFDTEDKNFIAEWQSKEKILWIHPWNVLLMLFYLVVLGVIIHACAGVI